MEAPTRRYKLTLSYRGTNYHGWQYQTASSTWKGETPPPGDGLPTVQQILTRAMSRVLNEPITLCGSSRTDAGVHAKGQVIHFDTTRVAAPPEKMRRAVNHQLPDDILVRAIEEAPADFHAILWTVSKRYQYAIWNAEDRPPFFADLCWHRWQPLDVAAMKEAAQYVVGTHDFSSFTKPGHGRESTVRTVLSCDVSSLKPKIVIGIEGTGFLWNMVHIIVGTLVEVGLGRYAPSTVAEMLLAKDRRAGGPTAPPHGLYLQWIKFRKPKGSGERAEDLAPTL